MSTDVAALEKLMVDWVEQWIEGEAHTPIDATTNLSHTGLLDSMAIVGLISYLEEQAETEFDFATYDPMAGVTIRGLIEHCVG
ncbi:phosphopantetheine-binding protein [Streptomyces sp. NPDC017979]|uniref:phosphopantetheine-binding protein n=1 Tax=Streptomyces sp. NPDC017979 TaxID=3365024 RepID=UPI0037B105AA